MLTIEEIDKMELCFRQLTASEIGRDAVRLFAFMLRLKAEAKAKESRGDDTPVS